MAMYENRPERIFNPADPLALINHEHVCSSVYAKMTNFETVSDALLYEQQQQIRKDADTYNILQSLGQHFVSLDSEGKYGDDDTKKRVYVSGVLLALSVIDDISKSLEIEPEQFREVWRANGTVKVIDINSTKFIDKTAQEKNEAIADGIVMSGQAFLDTMPQKYVEFVESVCDGYATMTDPNVFKAAYGYVMGSALQAYANMFRELEARRIIEDLDYDAGLNYLLEEPIATSLPDDDQVADYIDTEIFYTGHESFEAYIGARIEGELETNQITVETLQTLATLLYPNEYGYGALDENGEAFFIGGILAIRFVRSMCHSLDLDFDNVNRSWQKDSVRRQLDLSDPFESGRNEEVDGQVVRTLQRTELGFAIQTLLEKIARNIDYEMDEVVAFKNGMQYTLETYKKTIKDTIKSRISSRIKLAKRGLDTELEALLTYKRD